MSTQPDLFPDLQPDALAASLAAEREALAALRPLGIGERVEVQTPSPYAGQCGVVTWDRDGEFLWLRLDEDAWDLKFGRRLVRRC